ILLYPNPTNGIVILKNESSANLKHARITDVNGRIIKTINISNIGRETTISLENLTTGLYFVEISTETTTIVKSIVKQ
ncbi:MAG TPA: T9SS type A sorting domain-containing protein, partial [Sphingobacteriaceae bacterium]|nr:T9SS type A sorting domain-containing protein [Sphingobacteriaceae bacterium]